MMARELEFGIERGKTAYFIHGIGIAEMASSLRINYEGTLLGANPIVPEGPLICKNEGQYKSVTLRVAETDENIYIERGWSADDVPGFREVTIGPGQSAVFPGNRVFTVITVLAGEYEYEPGVAARAAGLVKRGPSMISLEIRQVSGV